MVQIPNHIRLQLFGLGVGAFMFNYFLEHVSGSAQWVDSRAGQGKPRAEQGKGRVAAQGAGSIGRVWGCSRQGCEAQPCQVT